MKFKEGQVVIDGTIHPVTIKVFQDGVIFNLIINGLVNTESLTITGGGGMTIIQNGTWVCYYGLNDVFSCKDAAFLSDINNHRDDHFDDSSGSCALPIVDVAGDCIVAAA